MQAKDIMSSPVITVGPRTPVLQVAALLRERRIGGVPVLAGNDLVGIVTERDLLHRHELGTEHRSHAPAWWRRVVAPGMGPDWYVKSHGRCAEHVMARIVVVAEPHTTLREILALFEGHRIGRVPVMRNGCLVGILTSADLVKALARGIWVPGSGLSATTDEGIRERLVSELQSQDWWNSGTSAVEVRLGIVRFTVSWRTSRRGRPRSWRRKTFRACAPSRTSGRRWLNFPQCSSFLKASPAPWTPACGRPGCP